MGQLTEQSKLDSCEALISDALTAYVQAGMALIQVQQEQLYITAGFKTFESYCKCRWKFSKSRAYQYIESAKVAQDLSTIVDIAPPQNEGQAREVAKVESEQERADLWTAAVDTAPRDSEGNPSVSAAHIAKTRKEQFEKPNGKPKPKPAAKPEPPAPDIPKAAAEGLAHKSDFDRWVRTLNALAKEVEAATEQPWGVMLPLSEIQIDVKDLRSAIKFGKPDDVCPRCKGKRCASCSKRGWVTREQKAGMV